MDLLVLTICFFVMLACYVGMQTTVGVRRFSIYEVRKEPLHMECGCLHHVSIGHCPFIKRGTLMLLTSFQMQMDEGKARLRVDFIEDDGTVTCGIPGKRVL